MYCTLLVLLSISRCASDNKNKTICGGRGECWHESGPGKHWLRQAECQCDAGYCQREYKNVVDAGGQAPVFSCYKCNTVDYIYTMGVTTYNLTVGVGTAWSYTSECSRYSALGPESSSYSSSMHTDSFLVGADTRIEATFNGGGGYGMYGALAGPTSPSSLPHPGVNGLQGMALADGDVFVYYVRGGGLYSDVGVTRTVTANELKPFRGRTLKVYLLSTYESSLDSFSWMCVRKVGIYDAVST